MLSHDELSDWLNDYYTAVYTLTAAERKVARRELLDVVCRAMSESVMRIARRLIKRLGRTPIPVLHLDDLHSAGMIGLVEACDSYDVDKGVPPIAFMRMKARWAMLNAVTESSFYSHRRKRKADVYRETLDMLEKKLGHRATDQDLTDALDMSRQEIRAMHQIMIDFPDGDTPVCVNHDAFDDTPADDTNNPESLASMREVWDALSVMVSRLPSIERRLLTLYFGEGWSLDKIGDDLGGITKQRAAQIKERVMVDLRGKLLRRFPEESLMDMGLLTKQ